MDGLSGHLGERLRERPTQEGERRVNGRERGPTPAGRAVGVRREAALQPPSHLSPCLDPSVTFMGHNTRSDPVCNDGFPGAAWISNNPPQSYKNLPRKTWICTRMRIRMQFAIMDNRG